MKTLPLSVELSNVALDALDRADNPQELLSRVENVLARYPDLLGYPTGNSRQERDLGADLQLNEYQFNYEKHSVQFQLVHFLPRGDWQMQGIRLS